VPRRGERVEDLTTVSQHISRGDIVDILCNELRNAGFTARTRTILVSRKPSALADIKMCYIKRVEEQDCLLSRTKSHFLSKETKDWADAYINELRRRYAKPRPKRNPFTCPP